MLVSLSPQAYLPMGWLPSYANPKTLSEIRTKALVLIGMLLLEAGRSGPGLVCRQQSKPQATRCSF